MNMTEKIAGLTFGCELEYVGISQPHAANVVARAVGGTVRYVGAHLNNYEVIMPDGRKWQIVSDASVGRGSGRMGCETVTPVLKWADMEMLQNVVRALRKARAQADYTCGLHIHVGAQGMTARQIQNLAKSWYMGEKIFVEGCGTAAARLARWTRPLEMRFLERMLKTAKPTMETLGEAYYGGPISEHRCTHYDDARYRTLNLHNLWNGNKGTVEFRLFEATTHAGEVKANVTFALSMVAKAMGLARVCAKVDKYECKGGAHDMKLMFHYLCWNGDDFKTARWHFLKRAKDATARSGARATVNANRASHIMEVLA